MAGLDTAVQEYPFEAWGLSGPDLLGLDVEVLEALGVWPLGHQELLLEAVEQLRNLVSAGIPGAAGSQGGRGEQGDAGVPWTDRGGCGITLGWVEGGRWGHRGTPDSVEGGFEGTLSWTEGGTWGHRGLGEGGDVEAPQRLPRPSIPWYPCPPQDTGLASTSLRTLTERLQELAQGIQSLVQEGLSAGDAPQPPSLTLLARVIDLVGAAKELFSWLNRSGAGEGAPGCWVPPTPGAEFCLPPRYLFSTLNDFSASRDIILLCAQLAETLQAVSARGWLLS